MRSAARAPASETALARAGRRAVYALDAILRRRLRIFEYSTHPECMLRVAIVPAPADFVLGDGRVLTRNARIADMHLWNERVPRMSARGPDLAWFGAFDRRLRLSLAELAAYLARHPELAAVEAVRIETAFGRPGADMERIGRRYGFDILRRMEPRSPAGRAHRFFSGLLFLALTWAYNPASRGARELHRQHDEYWMSRATLDRLYGAHRR